jgi:hypothetical protein
MAQITKAILRDQWDPEILKLVGEIVIALAQLDHVICLLPKRLSGQQIKDISKKQWKRIVNEDLKKRCDRIRDQPAFKHLAEIEKAKLNDLLDEAAYVGKSSNAIVHGLWGYNKDKPDGAIIARHLIWRGKEMRLSLIELMVLRDRIRQARDGLQDAVPPRPENITHS